jgi:fatty acid desaturase
MSQTASLGQDFDDVSPIMDEPVKINWYRTKVDKAVMSELMRKSDARAFAQVIPQLLLFAVTGTLAYLAFLNVHVTNWPWAVPLVLLALFVHGTCATFFAGIAGHELCHKTPFKTQFWNDFFLAIYSFLAWFDPVSYRLSHVKHHQVTVHAEHDGEVVLPQGLNWHGIKFILRSLTFDPLLPFKLLRSWGYAAFGESSKSLFFTSGWMDRILPRTKAELRREHRNWAIIVLTGHLILAALFIATGHWFLIIIVTLGCQYCTWLRTLCAGPQHIGLTPNVPDFRLCCRTYTCNWFPAFLYWNMQYHLEHHMFPAVPFYNLPRLRKAIEHDLPPAPHGLRATWKELLPIMRRQRQDPTYIFVPKLPAELNAATVFLKTL